VDLRPSESASSSGTSDAGKFLGMAEATVMLILMLMYQPGRQKTCSAAGAAAEPTVNDARGCRAGHGWPRGPGADRARVVERLDSA
jgi:hypothetical protein